MRGHAIKVVPPNLPWLHAVAMSPAGRHLAVGHPAGMIIILRLAKPGDVAVFPSAARPHRFDGGVIDDACVDDVKTFTALLDDEADTLTNMAS